MYGPVGRLKKPADRLTHRRLFSLTIIGRPAEKAGRPAATRLYTDLKTALTKHRAAPAGPAQEFSARQKASEASSGYVPGGWLWVP